MRGLLCAEFLDFAGSRFGKVPGLPDGGSCDAATCPGPGHLRHWADRVALGTGVPGGRLLQLFGAALFGRLVRGYPSFFVEVESTLDLIGRYEALVADEVRKLDGSAQPPHLAVVRRDGRSPEVVYRSAHDLADLAEGLLHGCILHFGDALDVERVAESDDARVTTFRLVERREVRSLEPRLIESTGRRALRSRAAAHFKGGLS